MDRLERSRLGIQILKRQFPRGECFRDYLTQSARQCVRDHSDARDCSEHEHNSLITSVHTTASKPPFTV